MSSLRLRLAYEPRELKFGTSGRRGEVVHLTQLEVYINVLAELEYLQSLEPAQGGIVSGDEFYFACDLRPSSAGYVPEQGGRGEIAQAVARAVQDAGQRPIYLGRIPTPALICYALERGRGSIMVTGSHIPFDRNGYKTNTARGELLKEHEPPINAAVARVRARLYNQPFDESLFDEQGRFKQGHQELPAENREAAWFYIERYTSFFHMRPLAGMRLLVYQHSAVGRDLLVEVLQRLGAETIPAGRSDTFVPIDTENIDAGQLAGIQSLVDRAIVEHGRIDAAVSADGDSDRPLILAVDAGTGETRFYGGDLVGMLVAEYLDADAVVVPVSCNDAIDRSGLASVVEPKTRIGSPFVIAGMEEARRKGRRAVCGWEANGGFLTGSDIRRGDRVLKALATRDAMLPILGVLCAARERGLSLSQLFERLPHRFSRAALLKQFPRPVAMRIIERLSEPDAADVLADFFPADAGFGAIERLDYTDGVRINFRNGDVAHLRPSGNADEFRIYAVAGSQERADAIAQMGIQEPDGILRRLEKAVAR
jgi:phosphomannomutase